MTERKLIYDVGMHQGEDTEFYLSRGHNVVGIEANPDLVAMLRRKFQRELSDGRLVLIAKAIAPAPGTIRFAIHPEQSIWGTADQDFIGRAMQHGDTLRFVEVEAISFAEVLRAHGVPHYLKIDIEGMDRECLKALRAADECPRFLSIETAATSNVAKFSDGFDELAELWSLGYRRFKYVDQAALGKLNGRLLDLEGLPIHYGHRAHGSGPFGEESPGRWFSIEEILPRMRRLIRYQNTLGFGVPRERRLFWRGLRRLRRYAKRLPANSWYDLHARLD